MDIATDLIKIYRGDTFAFSLAVTNYDDSAFDLTDYTLTFTAKSGTTTAITYSLAQTTDPALGIAYGTLSSLLTDIDVKTYDYDIQISNTDTPPLTYTIANGKLKILRDITT